MLLPRCMRRLLALAQPEGCDPSDVDGALEKGAAAAGDWKSTVHALNVLRVIFVDATLADDVGPYVTQARLKSCLIICFCVEGSVGIILHCCEALFAGRM